MGVQNKQTSTRRLSFEFYKPTQSVTCFERLIQQQRPLAVAEHLRTIVAKLQTFLSYIVTDIWTHSRAVEQIAVFFCCHLQTSELLSCSLTAMGARQALPAHLFFIVVAAITMRRWRCSLSD